MTEQDLRTSMNAYLKGRTALIEANQRLVFSLARSIVDRHMVGARRINRYDVLPDIAQEGSLGLMRAVHRYDPAKGFRFTTYATHWIRQNMEEKLRELITVY